MADAALMKGLLALSPTQKLEVIDRLWTEAARDLQSTPVTNAEEHFLDERIADAEAHLDDECDWAEVREEILANR